MIEKQKNCSEILQDLISQNKLRITDESNRFLYAECPNHSSINKKNLCINRVPNRGKPKGYYFCFGCHAFGEITPEEVDNLSKNVNCARVVCVDDSSIDWDSLYHEYFVKEFAEDKSKLLAKKWNVSNDVLRKLGCAWDGHAHIFPMFDENNKVIGLQRRFTNGFKCCVSKSRLGLFIAQFY